MLPRFGTFGYGRPRSAPFGAPLRPPMTVSDRPSPAYGGLPRKSGRGVRTPRPVHYGRRS